MPIALSSHDYKRPLVPATLFRWGDERSAAMRWSLGRPAMRPHHFIGAELVVGWKRDDDKGFSLVELLVSLTIVGVLSGMVLASLQLGFQTVVQARVRGVGNDAVITAQTVLRDRIEALVPSTRFEFTPLITDIRGDQRLFSFFAPAAPADRPASLTRYRLARSEAGELVLYSLPDTTAVGDLYQPGATGWTPQVLLTNVERLEISYFGTLPGNVARDWRSHWVERGNPPELVRVRVFFFEGDRRNWPDLVIRPVPNVNVLCTVDPASGKCFGNAD